MFPCGSCRLFLKNANREANKSRQLYSRRSKNKDSKPDAVNIEDKESINIFIKRRK